MKAVFDVRRHSLHHPEITLRYIVTNRSVDVEIARACVDDWVVIRETGRSGGHGYAAVARVQEVRFVGPERSGWEVMMSDYLAFPKPIALQIDGRYFEQEMREAKRSSQIGRLFQGRAIRELGDTEFEKITAAGFGLYASRVEPTAKSPFIPELMQDEIPFEHGLRTIQEVLLHRPIREAAFRRRVCSHYGNTCAVTRLQFHDGLGAFEVQAAHIWSVRDGGPDLIYNGICLCSTAHWLFDHYVISIDGQFRLLVNHALIGRQSKDFLPPAGTPLMAPVDERFAPHARYVDRHRSEFDRRFRGAGV